MLTRRRLLQGGIAAGSLFLPAPFAWVWAQSDGATRLMRAPKLALVIGNSAYRNVETLLNPGNDARAIAAALAAAGFAVTTVLDGSRERMLEAMRAHVDALAARKAVGLFYFAGHGLQLAWRNYLVPVEAALGKVEDVPARCVDVGELIGGIKRAANPMNVIILDACRDNPFARELRVEARGLSQMDAPPGTLLAYATAPGNLASDGGGAHGLYTENLLREMAVREAPIEDVFKRVRLGVRLASRGAQIPWESTSLEEDFHFYPPEKLVLLSREQVDHAFLKERTLFEAARDSADVVRLQEYLRLYPSGHYAEIAQLLLDRGLAAQGEKRVEAAPTAGNPNTLGSARADTLFKVGDHYRYRLRDLRLGKERELSQRVTAVSNHEVSFNNGRALLDPLGNVIVNRDGLRFTPRQDVPLDYVVGKRWTTRYDVIAGGTGTVELDLRIVAREPLTVPAGTFDCFRIEARGNNTVMFRPPVEITLTFWRAPEIVRRPIAFEEKRYLNQQVVSWQRQDLLSFKQG